MEARLLFMLLSLPLPLLLAEQPAFSQTADKNTLEITELKEIVREGALISGAIVTGVQASTISREGPTLSSFIPKQWAGKNVCAKVVSADGLYEASGPYRVPVDWLGGAAELPFPTRYGDRLRSMPEDGIGILVSLGECGTENGAPKSIALWNSDRADSVDLLLNSFRADSVFAYVGDQSAPVSCARTKSGGATAFDTKCRLSISGLSGQTSIEIYRVVGGKPSKPTALSIWFP